jgi:hypothetical protein
MGKDVLHVVPHEEAWAVKREGNERASSTHDTQKDAIDAARGFAKDGDDIVIHRPDGTIREKVTYTETNGEVKNTNSNGGRKVELHDVRSVGSRVSWGAVLAGSVVAIAVYAALTMLAIALGITTIDAMNRDTFAVSALVVMIFNTLVSLFVGGFVASRATAGEDKTEALIYGILVWGSLFVFTLLTSTGLGLGLGMMASNVARPQAEQGQSPSSEDVATSLGLSEEQKQKYSEVYGEARQVASQADPTTMAWLGFGGMVLSILASVGGAICGAGPELVLRQLRDRRTTVVKST